MLTEKEKAFVTHWEKQRAKGRWMYALKIGVLFWALPVYISLQIFYHLFRDGYVFEPARFITGLIVWMIMGFFGFGLITWWLNERNYEKKTKNPET